MRILQALIIINFGLYLIMNPTVLSGLIFVLLVGYALYGYQRKKKQKKEPPKIERYDIPMLIIGLLLGLGSGLISSFAFLFIVLCILTLIALTGANWKGLSMVTKDDRLECPYKGTGKPEEVCLNFEITPQHIKTVTNLHTWGVSAFISYYSMILILSVFVGFITASYL